MRFLRVIKACLLFAILMVNSALYAQRYDFHQYSVEHGLSQSQAYAVFQDNEGYIWACNLGGVNRFNGVEFENYSMRDGLGSNLVINGMCDSKGRLWFTTNGKGLSTFENGKFENYGNSDKHAFNQIRMIFELGDDQYLVSTLRSGLFTFDYRNKTFSRYVIPAFHPRYADNDFSVYEALYGPDSSLWLASNLGLLQLKDGKYNYYGKKELGVEYVDESKLFCLSINLDKDGTLIIGTSEGLFLMKDEKFTRYTVKEGLPDNKIRTVSIAPDGAYWMGTNAGLSKFSNGTFKNFTTNEGLTSNQIWDVHVDNEGNVWIGTNGTGINQLRSQKFSIIDKEQGLSGNLILSFIEDTKGRKWYGTYQDGVSVVQNGKYTAISRKDIPSDAIWWITEDKNGDILFATDDGLVIYDGNRFKTYTEKDGLPEVGVRAIAVDDQNVKWIGMGREPGLVRMEGEKIQYIPMSKDVEMRDVFDVELDSKGNVWFASDGDGVGLYKEGKYYRFSKEDGLINNEVLSLAIDSFDNIVVGCNGGGISKIQFLDNDQLEVSTVIKVNELSDDGVVSMYFDQENYLWIGTNRSVERFDYYDYLATGNINVKHYTFADGFMGIECNQNSLTEDSDGNLVIGTIHGAMIYDRSYDRPNAIEPSLYISDIDMFYEDVDWKEFVDSTKIVNEIPQELSLPYDKNHLTFRYEALSYKAPSKVKYQYKLEGLEDSWSPQLKATELSVTYPSIPPGDYTFMVRASNNDGLWNEKPLEFQFEIRPPFWQTPWFILLSIVSLILAAYFIIKWRFRTIQERAKLLEDEVKMRTRELEKEKELVESQNEILAEQKVEIETKSIELENAFSDITDSIRYAKKIQDAILNAKSYLKTGVGEYFILFKPKSIVSGDFYWVHELPEENKVLIAAADCTGHGVPGAFMSMIGNSLLNELVIDKGILDVDVILNMMRSRIISALSQTGEAGEARDGMDIALCLYDRDAKKVEFAGAFNPAYFVSNGELYEEKGDPQPVGFFYEDQEQFTKKVIDVSEGGVIYLFSDGFADQFGGPKGKKFKYKKFKELLVENTHLPMDEQRDILDREIEAWKAHSSKYGPSYEQIDDILVMGFKV